MIKKILLVLLFVNCLAVQVEASNTDTLYINPNPPPHARLSDSGNEDDIKGRL